jgi:hypothetical protein
MVVRRCISIQMTFVLALMFLQAPFLHIHAHESTEHHPHGFFHTHFPHHRLSSAKSLEFDGFDPDDDAMFQHWFSATLGDQSAQVFIPTFVYTVVLTWSVEPLLEPDILSGHDPPLRSRSAPRSPPV